MADTDVGANKIISDPNLIDLENIRRLSFSDLYHRNSSLFGILQDFEVQVYLIDKTNYGFFVTKMKDKYNKSIESDGLYEYQFLEFKKVLTDGGQEKLTPINILSLSELLNVCDSESLNGLFFYLNKIKDTEEENIIKY